VLKSQHDLVFKHILTHVMDHIDLVTSPRPSTDHWRRIFYNSHTIFRGCLTMHSSSLNAKRLI